MFDLLGTGSGSGMNGKRLLDPHAAKAHRFSVTTFASKHVKYVGIATTHAFVPLAVELMGPLGHEASKFLSDLGRHLSSITDDAREMSHLFQCVSILIERYNAVAFRGSFIEEEDDNVSS